MSKNKFLDAVLLARAEEQMESFKGRELCRVCRKVVPHTGPVCAGCIKLVSRKRKNKPFAEFIDPPLPDMVEQLVRLNADEFSKAIAQFKPETRDMLSKLWAERAAIKALLALT